MTQDEKDPTEGGRHPDDGLVAFDTSQHSTGDRRRVNGERSRSKSRRHFGADESRSYYLESHARSTEGFGQSLRVSIQARLRRPVDEVGLTDSDPGDRRENHDSPVALIP